MHHCIRETRLGVALLEAADTLSEAFDTGLYLQRLSDHCVDLLGASAAGIMLIEGGETVSLGVSSRRQRLAQDLLEVQHHSGPCLDSYGTGQPVPPIAILAAHASSRWPDFTQRALRHDIDATFAVPLRRNGTRLGALNVFVPAGGEHPAPDRESGLRLAQVLADAAAVGLTNHRTVARHRTLTSQLQQALSSRVRIEQAKGMLAERWRTGADETFTALRQYARRHRLPLHDVATTVIEGTEDAEGLARERPAPS
ncbi:GAF and ANTAR domain-containing protein [Streptomyces sporangiiformans]|uniref:GAF and ANTAR domain-containing protein n=1 Tax=Streptomyces sporangiiformans TaxID=2315329 RepID=A0A505D7V3_9ACTN|nr:GAF and ANTAR domain-containing protein [Streptomyces sporangiiformans]TPQ18402.1 GAF and ANTAR domain-containing protein [Streptomyces sporangiiformans]